MWDSCEGDIPPISDCEEVWGGLDLSARTDLTACVFLGKLEDRFYVYPLIFTPSDTLFERAKVDRVPYDTWVKQGKIFTTSGKTVDYKQVIPIISDFLSEVDNLRSIAFDRWRIDVFKKDCEELGIEFPLIPHGQGFKDMSPALDSLEAELLNTRIIHDGNPCLTMAAANAVVTKDPAGGRKLDKSKATNRIDPMVALTMACGVANLKSDEAPSYDVYLI